MCWGILSDGVDFGIQFMVLMVLIIQQRNLFLCEVKAEAPIQPIEVASNLTIIVLIVACLSWHLDFFNMGVFCNVGCPLDNCSKTIDTRDHTLEKLQLMDLLVIT